MKRAIAVSVVHWSLGLALGCLALIWLAARVHWADAIMAWQTAWQRFSLPALLPLIAALALSTLLRGKRLQIELGRCMPSPPAWRDCVTVLILHNAVLNVLPLRAGELGYPVLAKRWLGLDLVWGVGSLIRMRLQDLGLIVCAAIVCWTPWSPLARVASSMLVAAGAVALSMWIGHRLAARAAATRTTTAVDTSAAHRLPEYRADLLTWLLSLGNWTVKLGGIALALHALGATPTLAVAWRSALGGEIAAVLPAQGPAGLGTYEAGMWLGAGAAAGEPLLAAALAVHLVWLAVTLAAAAGILVWRRGSPPATPLRRMPL